MSACQVAHDDEILLNQISSFFKVQKTSYGGRGCFASQEIPSGTIVSRCYKPLSSAITKDFKREVCHWCHIYNNGDHMKFKLLSSDANLNTKSPTSIGFCTEECMKLFQEYDYEDVLLNNLISIEMAFAKHLQKRPINDSAEKENSEFSLLEAVIEESWARVDEWEVSITKMKPSKILQQLPILTEEEYIEVKFVLGVLFELYKNDQIQKNGVLQSENAGLKVANMSSLEYSEFEIKILELLQSNEYEKLKKYPALLNSFINVYKFIRLTFPSKLQKYINTTFIRNIIGKELGNAFGLWSRTDNEDEDREYLGFSLYPSASFFNHSCLPNLKRILDNEDKSTLLFIATKDILAGEELSISYGGCLDETVETRQNKLCEWFFKCNCLRCVDETAKLKLIGKGVK